jgi:peptidyl-prolyl cis-trans isomerase-like protein 2
LSGELIVNQGNVFDMNSLQLLAIKPKTWRDLVSDEQFERKDIITIQVRRPCSLSFEAARLSLESLSDLSQDPKNLAARDLREYDYVKKDKKITDAELEGDPLKGINVDAAGGASKLLKLLAEKVSFGIRPSYAQHDADVCFSDKV